MRERINRNALTGGETLFDGDDDDLCPACSASFEHTPELCAQRRIAAALEEISNMVSDINENGLYTLKKER